MARDSCDTGRQMYKTKQQAALNAPFGAKIKRCDRCRQWHIHEKGRRGKG